MDSEVICNPKNYDSLTHSVNNTGLRNASASKNDHLDGDDNSHEFKKIPPLTIMLTVGAFDAPPLG